MRRAMLFVTYGRRWLIIVTETKGTPPARALWPFSSAPVSFTRLRPACSLRPRPPVLRRHVRAPALASAGQPTQSTVDRGSAGITVLANSTTGSRALTRSARSESRASRSSFPPDTPAPRQRRSPAHARRVPRQVESRSVTPGGVLRSTASDNARCSSGRSPIFRAT